MRPEKFHFDIFITIDKNSIQQILHIIQPMQCLKEAGMQWRSRILGCILLFPLLQSTTVTTEDQKTSRFPLAKQLLLMLTPATVSNSHADFCRRWWRIQIQAKPEGVIQLPQRLNLG